MRWGLRANGALRSPPPHRAPSAVRALPAPPQPLPPRRHGPGSQRLLPSTRRRCGQGTAAATLEREARGVQQVRPRPGWWDRARAPTTTSASARSGKIEQEPKVGEWLEKEVNSDNAIEEWQSARCSVCDKYHTTPYMYYFSHYDYCPHCGTRMEGRQKVDKRRSKRNR